MTQEEKELLLKDLCARLPYGVVIHTWYNGNIDIKCTGIDLYTNTINLDISNDDDAKVYIDNVKPYLRPMSSMTEEEKREVEEMAGSVVCYNELEEGSTLFDEVGFDWLNAHHFDYRGLIEKGIALEAPEGMYNTKTE